MVKKWIKKLFYGDVNGFGYTVDSLVTQGENIKKISLVCGKVLNNDFLKNKKSDTLFILGSGPSINSLKEADWGYIRTKDSIGFNFWPVHTFVPSFYLFQLPRSENNRNALLLMLRDRMKDYKDVPFILRGDVAFENDNEIKMFLGDVNEVYLAKEFAISSTCQIEPNQLLKFFKEADLLNHGIIPPVTPKLRASVNLLIILGYVMGYKKIVLCGIDMLNSKHFWENESYMFRTGRYNISDHSKQVNLKVFNDVAYSKNTVELYIKEMAKWMYKESKCQLYLGNMESILYPEIPIFNFSEPDS